MEKRTLGRTGLNVAVVGFGALPMGGFYGPVDDAVIIKALHAAIDAGVGPRHRRPPGAPPQRPRIRASRRTLSKVC